jgi:hypothetical protein
LSQRDIYRIIQDYFIGDFEIRVFNQWLKMALLAGEIEGLSPRDFDRCCYADFCGRTWAWIDPARDIAALKEEIALNINSASSACRERGKDFAAIALENESDKKILDDAGLLPVVPDAASGTDQTDSDRSAIEFETLKSKFDAYGVAVRAGCITPQTVDEASFRDEAGLPEMSKEAKQAWVDDKGIRRPITLQGQGAFQATQEATEKSPKKQSAPANPDSKGEK